MKELASDMEFIRTVTAAAGAVFAFGLKSYFQYSETKRKLRSAEIEKGRLSAYEIAMEIVERTGRNVVLKLDKYGERKAALAYTEFRL